MMVASLGLSTSLQCKIVKSCSIDTTEVKLPCTAAAKAKEDTEAYHQANKGKSAKERANGFPPYVLVWFRLVEYGASLTEKHLEADSPDRVRYAEYWRRLQAFSRRYVTVGGGQPGGRLT